MSQGTTRIRRRSPSTHPTIQSDHEKKRQAQKKNAEAKKKRDELEAQNNEKMHVEQFKFRGSMSSMDNRHERVPSKPVIISITTPKGTKHVADQFKRENEEEGVDDLPPVLHEDDEDK